jgi:phospholipid/cholesterol/gamma-HCH transport system substrate-binding protein
MKQSSIRDFMTGLTAIVGLLGLSTLFILFGQISEVSKKHYALLIHTSAAAGLKDTANVTLNGVRIGQLRRISILPGNRGVELTASIREGVTIPRVVDLSVESSFVGETSLELTIPRTATDTDLADTLKPGETLQGKELKTLFTRIADGVQEPLDRLTKTADKIDLLADEYTKVGKHVNELLEPRSPADVAAGKDPNVRTAIARLNTALDGANSWLTDPELRNRTKDLITKADGIATQLGSTVNTIDAVTKKFDGVIGTTADNFNAAVGTLNDTLRDMQGATEQLAIALESVNTGKGTLGQLVSNPDLYHSLNDAAKRLEKALGEVELLAQKIKAEGVKVGL